MISVGQTGSRVVGSQTVGQSIRQWGSARTAIMPPSIARPVPAIRLDPLPVTEEATAVDYAIE